MEPDACRLVQGHRFHGGTAFAYVANRYWTFNHQAHPTGSHWRFMALYAATLGANVVINTLTLKHLPASQQMVQVAFVAATGVSAVLNFIGMKFFVFRMRVSDGSL